MPAFIEWFKRTDEDDITGIQFVVVGTPFQQIGINHGLVIARTAIQAVVIGLSDLHFDVVDCIFIIGYENIETDALAVVLHLHVLFFFRIGDIPNGDLQDFLQHTLTNPLAPHNQLKHVIITNRQVLPWFNLVTHVIHPLFIIA